MIAHKLVTYNISKSGCWECVSHKPNSDGYPKITIRGKIMSIHRYYFEKYNGVIPRGLIVRHTCDNRKCINPDHLVMGTHKDNALDRVSRNRSAVGIASGQSKLTEDQVRFIKNYSGKNYHLAKMFNVDNMTIAAIKNGRTWKHIT
jgi:hypothetical protein